MDRELFIDTMNKIEALAREQDEFDVLLRKIDPEFGGGYIHNKTIFLLEELLSKMVNDKYDNISYYMWEIDFGKEWEPGCITEEDGTPIPLSNAGELYDLIMESNKE